MTSPFDSKNRVAAALDRLALRVLLFVLSVGYFFFLWHSGALSLLAGSALFILAMLTLLLLERRTLARRRSCPPRARRRLDRTGRADAPACRSSRKTRLRAAGSNPGRQRAGFRFNLCK